MYIYLLNVALVVQAAIKATRRHSAMETLREGCDIITKKSQSCDIRVGL